ncbi:MAG: hypothetical protein H7X71_03960, partial [Chitinophagales bacterium]|nr:hypothetical protein [Chitinophagales bacterium]
MRIKNDVKDRDLFGRNFDQQEKFNSAGERDLYLNDILRNAYENGFLAAYYTVEEQKKDTSFIRFYKGTRMLWAELRVSAVESIFLQNAGYREKDFAGKIFRYTEIVLLMESMLEFAEENGYPFATVKQFRYT